jgi:outer membrane protein, heavy metal efflux system
MHHYMPLLVKIGLMLFLPELALAQSDHEPLRTNSALNFETIFQSALTAAPEAPVTAARLQQANSFEAVGRRWINNRPSWQANYIDDGLLDNLGQREMEEGIQLDLWRLGEREQAQALGSSYGMQAEAWQNYFKILVAGRLRAVLADIARAEALLVVEREATVEAQRLLEITMALFEAGQLAELDVLQVRGLLLQQQGVELEAEAELVDAELNYSVLTGLDVRPEGAHQETLSPQLEIESSHPALQYAQAVVDLAGANIEKARRDALGSPRMTVGVRRERGIRQQPYNDSFGLSFSVPFGGKADVAANVSSARSRKVDAEIEYTRMYQNLNAQLHEAEHRLFVAEESLDLRREQAELSQQHWQMSRTAFSAGEGDLTQVVMALQRAQASAKQYQILQLERQRLITDYNQALGELP